MAVSRWSPFGELTRLRDEMDHLFDRFLPVGEEREALPAITPTVPSVDVYDRDGTLVVEAELPGIKKEDVNVTIEEDTLTISGETKREEEKREEGFYRRERHYGKFTRTIPLPTPVKADEASAKFEEGVLEITLPKTEEKPKGKRIEVK